MEYAIVAIKVQPKDALDIWEPYTVNDVMKQLTKMNPEFLYELQLALNDHLWSSRVMTREQRAQDEAPKENLCGTGT